jgi:hypothetical protein
MLFRHFISGSFAFTFLIAPDALKLHLFRNVHHSGSLPTQLAVV